MFKHLDYLQCSLHSLNTWPVTGAWLSQIIPVFLCSLHLSWFTVFNPDKAPYSTCLKVKVKLLSRVWLFATPWIVNYQAPPSMGFSRQECWSELPFTSPGDLPNPGIEPGLPHCRQMLYHLSHQEAFYMSNILHKRTQPSTEYHANEGFLKGTM